MRKKHGIRVRGLTRKEVKELEPNGFLFSFYNPPVLDPEKMNAGIQRALELCVLDVEKYEALADEDHVKSLQVFRAITAETYGIEDEEKNLPVSGNGSQTADE